VKDQWLPTLAHRRGAVARFLGRLSDLELEEELTLAALSRLPWREDRYESLLAERRRRRFLRRAPAESA
jgi:hypothetical protein